MASINFYVGGDFLVELAGSGLGFYGYGGFGSSVAVGQYQDNTFVTNSTGVTQGSQANNVKYVHSASGQIAGGVNLNLLDIPNNKSTVNVRFSHSSSVQVQNAELRIYDRSDITKPASGVTTKVAEIIHPTTGQTGLAGSGDSAWLTPTGSAVTVKLANSPGTSGLLAGNGLTSTTADVRHDWYLAISAMPDSIGAKDLFGLYISLEYL
jgi:hypothetical protein